MTNGKPLRIDMAVLSAAHCRGTAMNGIQGLLSIPSAATAIDMAGQAVETAVSPFAMVMHAAMGAAAAETRNARGDFNGADESLGASVARRLQELLTSLGLRPGDRVKLEIDAAGDIRVADSDAGIGSIEAALHADPQLADDLRRLARSRSAQAGSPFGEAELRIEVGESDAAAGLTRR
jgi:hypothetical protein